MVLCVTVVKLGNSKRGSPCFSSGLHLSLRWGRVAPPRPAPSWEGCSSGMTPGTAGTTGFLAPQAGAGGTSQPLKTCPPGGHAQPLGVGRLPRPVPARRPVPRYPRCTRTSVQCPGLSQPQRRRVPPAAGLVRRPLGLLRGWWSRAGRAGQSQEHFGGGRGF